MYKHHARIQKGLFIGGPTLTTFFLVDEWIQVPLKSGHHRPARGGLDPLSAPLDQRMSMYVPLH